MFAKKKNQPLLCKCTWSPEWTYYWHEHSSASNPWEWRGLLQIGFRRMAWLLPLVLDVDNNEGRKHQLQLPPPQACCLRLLPYTVPLLRLASHLLLVCHVYSKHAEFLGCSWCITIRAQSPPIIRFFWMSVCQFFMSSSVRSIPKLCRSWQISFSIYSFLSRIHLPPHIVSQRT